MTQSCGIESLAAVTVILEPGAGPAASVDHPSLVRPTAQCCSVYSNLTSS